MKKYVIVLLTACLALYASTVWADSDKHERNHRYSRMSSAKFYGIIDTLPQNGITGTWLINGRQVTVTPGTEIEEKRGRLAPGVYVKVEGYYTDNAFVAEEIEVKRSKRRS